VVFTSVQLVRESLLSLKVIDEDRAEVKNELRLILGLLPEAMVLIRLHSTAGMACD